MFEPGQIVNWMYRQRGGYGFTIPIKAEVVKHTPKRVQIRVWRKTPSGEEIPALKYVLASSLKPAPNNQN